VPLRNYTLTLTHSGEDLGDTVDTSAKLQAMVVDLGLHVLSFLTVLSNLTQSKMITRANLSIRN